MHTILAALGMRESFKIQIQLSRLVSRLLAIKLHHKHGSSELVRNLNEHGLMAVYHEDLWSQESVWSGALALFTDGVIILTL